MPALETMDLYQRAVLWLKTGYDSYGQPAVGAPMEVAARWVDKTAEVLDAQGNNVSIDATLITIQAAPPGSVVWQGTLADWYGTGSAGQDTGLYEVVGSDQTPDLKNRYVRYELTLKRHKNSLPGA